MKVWLTITVLLALRVSQSTAWMACEDELCEGSHWQTCIESFVSVAMVVVSPLKSVSSDLSPRSSRHRSWLWTSTTPSLMFPVAVETGARQIDYSDEREPSCVAVAASRLAVGHRTRRVVRFVQEEGRYCKGCFSWIWSTCLRETCNFCSAYNFQPAASS